jgi:hypothetical protein
MTTPFSADRAPSLRHTLSFAAIARAALAVALVTTPGANWRSGTAVAQSSSASPHRIAVPLSDPSRPATVRVGLLSGSITVSGWSGKEVVVDTRPRDQSDEKDERDGKWDGKGENDDSRARGLRRVPNMGSGLTIEESDNVVEVSANSWNNSTDVVLQVPAGSTLELQTVNDGDITVRDVQGEVNAENTNGNVTILGITGSAVVHALNGEIVARFTRLDASQNTSSFSSMNGNIDLTLPANARAELRVKSDNGEIYTDFDVQWGTKAESLGEGESESEQSGKKKSHKKQRRYGFETSMVGTLGSGGGPTLRLQTFNGNIYVRKAGASERAR